MKDQQRSPQSQRLTQPPKQEQKELRQAQTARISAQQWVRLLRGAEGTLTEIPAALLEQLAQSVGNSSLAELLRQSGGGGEVRLVPYEPERGGAETQANEIVTSPPRLYPFEWWRGAEVPRLSTVKPCVARWKG